METNDLAYILQREKNRYAGFDTSDENQCLYSINLHAHNIQRISDPNEKIQMAAVRKETYAIQFIKYPTEDVQLYCVKDSGPLIGYIQDPTDQVIIEAVKQNKKSIGFIDIDRLNDDTRKALVSLCRPDVGPNI